MMRLPGSRILTVSTAAIAMILVAGTPPAASQTLMDLLFRNRQRAEPVPAAPAPAPVQRAAPPRVSGPQYYTYRAGLRVRVGCAAGTPQRARDDALAAPRSLDPDAVGSTVVHGAVAREPLPPVAAPRPTGSFCDALPSALDAGAMKVDG